MAVGRVNVGGGGGISTIAPISESGLIPGITRDLICRGEYLYAGADSLSKLSIQAMEVIGSAGYGLNKINAVAQGSQYLYVAGELGKDGKICKVDPSTLDEVSVLTTTPPTKMEYDEGFLYTWGTVNTARFIKKINTETMKELGRSDEYNSPGVMLIDGNSIYCFTSAQEFWEVDKNTLETIRKSEGYISIGVPYSMTTDRDYLYVVGNRGVVYKVDINTLSIVGESPSYGDTLYSIVHDRKYLYCGGVNTRNIWKIDKDSMEVISKSISRDSHVWSLLYNNKRVYSGGDNVTILELANVRI